MDLHINLYTENFIIQDFFKTHLERVSTISENVFLLHLQKKSDYNKISEIIEKRFDVVSIRDIGNKLKSGLWILLNLVSDNVLFYEKYNFVSADKKNGFAFEIKSPFRRLKNDYMESMNFSYNFINDCSKKLHYIRKSGSNLDFGYDGKTIDIRIS